MEKEFLVERENFQVTKEKIIKTNELLNLYQEKTERLAKATQAFKQLKIKQQNLFQESQRLKMDNERLNDTVNKYKDEKGDAVRNLTKLQSEYTSLEGKYEQTMIDSQLAITDLETKVKQCCCDKNLGTLSPRKKTADEKIRALKQRCSELMDFENKLRLQNKALVQKNKKLEDTATEKLATSTTKNFKEINSLKDELLKAKATIQEQNRLNNTIKFQKEERENELDLLKSQVSVLEDQCRCLTEQLNSAKNRDIDRCDIFTQTEHSLPQDEKTVPSCHQRKYYEIDSDEWARIRKEITFTDQLLSPIRSDSSSDTSITKSRRRRTARSRDAKMRNKADKKVPNIIVTPSTPLTESVGKSTLLPEFALNDSLENKHDNTSVIPGAAMNLNNFNSVCEHASIKVDSRLFPNVDDEQLPKNSSIRNSKLLHKNVNNKSEVDLGGISTVKSCDTNGQHFNIDDCLLPNNQISREEQSTISFGKHANIYPFNVEPVSTPISIESELMNKDANCCDNSTKKDLRSKKDNISEEYSTISLTCAEKSFPVEYSTNELTNREHDFSQRDSTALAQKKSKEDLTRHSKVKARTNRRRALWMPYNTNNFVRPRIPKRRQRKESENMLGKGDTIMNALQMLKANNISFTISSDSMQPTFPNFAVAQPTSETFSQSQSFSRIFPCPTVCWNKKCMENGMMLREVHQNEEPELLGFFDIKPDTTSSSSVKENNIKEQPLKTVKLLAQQLLIAFKEINSSQKRPAKKYFKPRRNSSSEFKSATESELERLVDTPDVLQRNKRMLAAARRQSFKLNKEIGRESDIDGLFDSGLVTASTKHDTDSQDFLSYNEDGISNALSIKECNTLPASSKEIIDLMLLTPSKMNKMLSPLCSSVKSHSENKSKQNPLSNSRTLAARRLVDCPVLPKIESVYQTVAALSGNSEQSCVSLPELSINSQDLNCSIGGLCTSSLERTSSLLDVSIDKPQREDRLVGKNQRESKRRPKNISETKVENIGTRSPNTRIIQLRNKSIRVKTNIDDIKMLEKQYRQSLWNGSSKYESDSDNVRPVRSRNRIQSVSTAKGLRNMTDALKKVSESENNELFSENLQEPVQLNQSDNASPKSTKVLRRVKRKSKRCTRSSKKIVSREFVCESDSDCSRNEERVNSRISFVEDRLENEAKQESEIKAKLRRSKRCTGQRTFNKMLSDADESVAKFSQPWKTNVQFRNRMESLGGDSQTQLNRNTRASLKKKCDRKQLFGSETDSSCADASSVDCEIESIVKNEPKDSKKLSAEINHQIEIKDHFKQEVSCQINIPDAENEIFDDFNSMVQDENFEKGTWLDNLQIEKDHIEDSAEFERSLQKNFDEFKTRYRAKYLGSKHLSDEVIINRASCEEGSKTVFSWDVTNDQKESSRSHGVSLAVCDTSRDVTNNQIENSRSHDVSHAVCDTSNCCQSKIPRNTEDVKEDKKINIVENIIVSKGILPVLPTSSYGGEWSRSDTTDQNIISQPLLGNNVKLETGESSKNTNYNWKDLSNGLAIDAQTSKSDKSNLLPDSPASPDLVKNMEPTSRKLSRGEILDTINKLILLSRDANVLEEVVNTFSGQTVDYVAHIILGKLCQDIFDKPDNDYPPSPLMTTTQRILLGFLTKLDDSTHKGITDKFLDIAELSLFKKTCTANIVEPVTRVYTAICRMRMNISRIRRFICESFYFANNYAISIVFIVLTMWGNILPMASNLTEYPLAKVIVQLCYTTTQTTGHILQLRDLLQKYFGYPAEHWNPDELFEELLDQYIKDPFKRQYDFALLLFLKSRPAKWVFQKIKDHLILLYHRIPPGNSNLKANLLIFMGNICHSFEAHIEQEWRLIVEMNQWFETLQNVEDDLLVQKSIILAKYRLPKKCSGPVKKINKSCKRRKANQSNKDESSTILELSTDRNEYNTDLQGKLEDNSELLDVSSSASRDPLAQENIKPEYDAAHDPVNVNELR